MHENAQGWGMGGASLRISSSVVYLQIYFVVEFSPVNYPQRFPKYAVRIAEEINHKSG